MDDAPAQAGKADYLKNANYIYWIGTSLGVLAAVYVAVTNMAVVSLQGFGGPVAVPFAGVVIGAYACGLLTIGSLWRSFTAREKRGEQKMVEWEKQDAKLMQEIATDREKLLEAKVATLETALAKALDRAKKKEAEK
jgi:uncharacterized integral membrane protein